MKEKQRVFEYQWKDLERIVGLKEIDQSRNFNANSRLFIENSSVYKLFDRHHPSTPRCISTIETLSRRLNTDQYNHFATPDHLISFEDRIVGYKMPFFRGSHLGDVLANNPSLDYVNTLFRQLFRDIQMLPDDIAIGDLHAGNVIVCDGVCFLIDLDGFTRTDSARGTCPLDNCEWYHGPRATATHKVVISRKTDITCLIALYLDFLLGRPLVLGMNIETLSCYLRYLSSIKGCNEMVAVFQSMLQGDYETMQKSTLIDDRTNLSLMRYDAFRRDLKYCSFAERDMKYGLK